MDGGQTIIQEPKTAKGRRQLALTPSSALILRDHRVEQEKVSSIWGYKLAGDSLVFCHPDGKPLTPDVISHDFRKIARRASLKGIRLHDLRHTHASLMLQQGIHPKVVSERLGHANIQMTLDTYSHVWPGIQAAAALRFDESIGDSEAVEEAVSEIVG